MKDIKLAKSPVEFGNTSRDTLLKIALDNEIIRAKEAESIIGANTGMQLRAYIDDIVVPGGVDKNHVLFIELLNRNSEVISTAKADLDTELIINKAELKHDEFDWYILFTRKDGSTFKCSVKELLTTCEAKIAAEASERQAQDTVLASQIAAEVSRATAVEETLDAKISAEATIRFVQDASLSTRIDAEVSRATAVEQTKVAKVGDILTGNLVFTDDTGVIFSTNKAQINYSASDSAVKVNSTTNIILEANNKSGNIIANGTAIPSNTTLLDKTKITVSSYETGTNKYILEINNL